MSEQLTRATTATIIAVRRPRGRADDEEGGGADGGWAGASAPRACRPGRARLPDNVRRLPPGGSSLAELGTVMSGLGESLQRYRGGLDTLGNTRFGLHDQAVQLERTADAALASQRE